MVPRGWRLFPTCLLVLNIFPSLGISCVFDKQCVVEIDSKGKLHLVNDNYALRRLIVKQLNDKDQKAGFHKDCAVTSCKKLKELDSSATSGLYWIDLDGGSHKNAFKAFCDMKTDGGGWTLVYSYTFTKYGDFDNVGNAVTPRPNWPASGANVPVSTTSPKTETDFNAIEFNFWQKIGNEVLIKSNINNWVSCSPVNGSLVLMKDGSFNCKVVKKITSKCSTTAPSEFSAGLNGPCYHTSNKLNNLYYYFDGSTSADWPVHDPCGTDQDNHLKDVHNPHGNIYIR